MTLVSIPGAKMRLHSLPEFLTTSISNVSFNAANFMRATVGRIYIPGGGSKTISSSGGSILWRTGSAITFVNAGTTLRIGIQDVNASGNPDGSWDVYRDYVGGTDTLNTTTLYEASMTTGSKTMTDGDIIALTFQLTSRGGSDSIGVAVQTSVTPINTNNTTFPYTMTAATTKAIAFTSIGLIKFDDGTFGWIEQIPYMYWTTAAQSIASNTTPDEAAALFKVPFDCAIDGFYCRLANVATTDNFEAILYSDAKGTPSAQRTATFSPVLAVSSATAGTFFVKFAEITLQKNVWYGLAIRPTTTNAIDVIYADLGSGRTNVKQVGSFGLDVDFGVRTDQTGAFTIVQDYYLPILV